MIEQGHEGEDLNWVNVNRGSAWHKPTAAKRLVRILNRIRVQDHQIIPVWMFVGNVCTFMWVGVTSSPHLFQLTKLMATVCMSVFLNQTCERRTANVDISQSQYIYIPSYPHRVRRIHTQSVSKTPNPPRTRPKAFVDDDPVAWDPAAVLIIVAGPLSVTTQSSEETPLGQQPLGSQ